MKSKTKIAIISVATLLLIIAVLMFVFNGATKTADITVLDNAGNPIGSLQGMNYDGEYADFCDVVIDELAEILGEQPSGTYTVYSTFDKTAFDACEKSYESTSFSKVDFAQVVTKVDGQILSVFSAGNNKLNFAVEKTQPYSAFKPISVYAPAFENGTITWASSFFDSPVKQITDEDGTLKDWPANATGVYQNVNVSLEDCIKHSLNTAAVKCLIESGISESVDFLYEKFGIDVTFERDQIALKGEDESLHNIALGYLTAGVSPLDMAGYYQIFADGGKYIKPYAVLKITDEDDNVIYEHKAEKKQVISEETAEIMNRLLQNTLTKGGTAEKAQYDDLLIGGKTGTGSNYRGNWFVGYTPEYCCAVWHGAYPGNVCAETFSVLVSGLIHDKSESYPECKNVVRRGFCKESGGMITMNCNSMASGFFASDCKLDKCELH